MNAAAAFQVLGGLFGAAGVALSALAAHGGGGNAAIAATMLLVHAPTLLVVGMADGARATRWAAAAIGLGVILFCGDLLIRDLGAPRLFPMAAPAGGLLTIAGWLGLAASAFSRR